MSDSGFFSTPDMHAQSIASAPELIHQSEGGWSQIYLIDKDGRFRVYKALKEAFRGDIKYETLLRKEFEIGYRMSHPSLCEIYGFKDIEGLGHCIEMEWIDGMPLSAFLQHQKPTRQLSERLMLQLCDAVAYCHARQVVHRDIKPENIMITHSGHFLKLIDFGLSDSDAHSIFKSACGTTSFAAPETISGNPSDTRSDIYSLGKIFLLFHPIYARMARKCMRADAKKRFQTMASVRAAVKHAGRDRALRRMGAAALLTAAALAWPVLRGVLNQADATESDHNASLQSVTAPVSSDPQTVRPQPLPQPAEPPSVRQSTPQATVLTSEQQSAQPATLRPSQQQNAPQNGPAKSARQQSTTRAQPRPLQPQSTPPSAPARQPEAQDQSVLHTNQAPDYQLEVQDTDDADVIDKLFDMATQMMETSQ